MTRESQPGWVWGIASLALLAGCAADMPEPEPDSHVVLRCLAGGEATDGRDIEFVGHVALLSVKDGTLTLTNDMGTEEAYSAEGNVLYCLITQEQAP